MPLRFADFFQIAYFFLLHTLRFASFFLRFFAFHTSLPRHTITLLSPMFRFRYS